MEGVLVVLTIKLIYKSVRKAIQKFKLRLKLGSAFRIIIKEICFVLIIKFIRFVRNWFLLIWHGCYQGIR